MPVIPTWRRTPSRTRRQLDSARDDDDEDSENFNLKLKLNYYSVTTSNSESGYSTNFSAASGVNFKLKHWQQTSHWHWQQHHDDPPTATRSRSRTGKHNLNSGFKLKRATQAGSARPLPVHLANHSHLGTSCQSGSPIEFKLPLLPVEF